MMNIHMNIHDDQQLQDHTLVREYHRHPAMLWYAGREFTITGLV